MSFNKESIEKFEKMIIKSNTCLDNKNFINFLNENFPIKRALVVRCKDTKFRVIRELNEYC